jgi:8-oxo-dGTP pyrophosphatase MutT (NUDIX family)
MTHMKQTILDAISAINPLDDLEQEHKDDVLAWVKSGAPLFRISKPDNPPKHLVSYFVLYDPQSSQLMLIDHIKAQLWLPTGGHVEIDEDPRTAVSREAYEELRITAKFDTIFGHDPLFVTVTETKGQGTHTDVSLWYVIEGKSTAKLAYDEGEMNSYKWLSLQDVLDTDISELDPHMHRFVTKMQRALASR